MFQLSMLKKPEGKITTCIPLKYAMISPSSMIIRNNHRVKQSNYTATNIPLNIPLTSINYSSTV